MIRWRGTYPCAASPVLQSSIFDHLIPQSTHHYKCLPMLQSVDHCMSLKQFSRLKLHKLVYCNAHHKL